MASILANQNLEIQRGPIKRTNDYMQQINSHSAHKTTYLNVISNVSEQRRLRSWTKGSLLQPGQTNDVDRKLRPETYQNLIHHNKEQNQSIKQPSAQSAKQPCNGRISAKNALLTLEQTHSRLNRIPSTTTIKLGNQTNPRSNRPRNQSRAVTPTKGWWRLSGSNR